MSVQRFYAGIMIQAGTVAALAPKAAQVMRVAAKIAHAVGTAQHIAHGMGARQPMGMGRLAFAGHAQPGDAGAATPPGHRASDLVQEIANIANRSGHSAVHESKGPAAPSDEKGVCF